MNGGMRRAWNARGHMYWYDIPYDRSFLYGREFDFGPESVKKAVRRKNNCMPVDKTQKKCGRSSITKNNRQKTFAICALFDAAVIVNATKCKLPSLPSPDGLRKEEYF